MVDVFQLYIRLFIVIIQQCSGVAHGRVLIVMFDYCKSTNFGVLLYLANLANCVFSLIFVAANIYVGRTLHRRATERRQI